MSAMCVNRVFFLTSSFMPTPFFLPHSRGGTKTKPRRNPPASHSPPASIITQAASQMAVYTVARATTATAATATSSEEDAKTYLERNLRCVIGNFVSGGQGA